MAGLEINSSWQEEYIYLGSRLFAKYQSGTAVYYLYEDALGSVGTLTNNSGQPVQIETEYPWGQQWKLAGPVLNEQFAGMQERDEETGNDPTPNRMYASSLGRWLSPDPAGRKAVSLTGPQTWNMYAYVRDNPLTLTDPTGLCTVDNEHHNFVWCAAHSVGITTTQKERTNWVEQNIVAVNKATGRTLNWSKASAAQINAAYNWGQGQIAKADGQAIFGAMLGPSGLLARAVMSSGPQSAGAAVSILGASGPQFTSKTLWNEGGARIDVENPAPGNRPGQIHFQDPTGKYMYDIGSGRFEGLSSTKNEQLLSRPEVQEAIQKGLRYLGVGQ